MRRSILTTLAVVAGLTLTSVPVQAVSQPMVQPSAQADDRGPTDLSARRALSTAERVLSGEATRDDPSATLALRDLWASRDALGERERRTADRLLARPTDGAVDPYGFGYTAPSRKKCARTVCLHWVTDAANVDAPPSKRWVKSTLKYVQRTWNFQTGKLGYRKPLTDKKSGGNKKLDVYLKDVGPFGLYGFCAPEQRTKKFLASGFCVIDDDFAAAQFGAPPKKSMKVTVAHELFHTVQFAYDAFDDGWAMEATATWMEERQVDGADDNRQYFPTSPLRQPAVPLDYAVRPSTNQYGQWVFFEYLTKKYGRDVVRQIWTKMGAYKGAADLYSVKAIAAVLRKRGGMTRVFSEFAASNTIPGKVYPEGRRWPSAPALGIRLGTSQKSTGKVRIPLNHLASANLKLRPDASLKKKSYRVKIKIDGPKRKTSPGAFVLVDRRRGGIERRYVRLDGKGRASVKVPFSRKRVTSVTVTVANVSTRYRCFRQTEWACQGVPLDDNERFVVKATVRK